MHEPTAYESLAESSDDLRWAFGTGFADPLVGVDCAVPPEVDGDELAAYCLMLGDDALVMSHRLQEWVARAPELEEETALANIALDLLGQARLLLTRAGQADGSGRSEDAIAFGRPAEQFRNVRLVEYADANFAGLVARLLVFSSWRLAMFDALRSSRDRVLAAVAEKAVNELTYHRDYAAQWVIRLGDGTHVSHERVQAGVQAVEPLVDELFLRTEVENHLFAAEVAVDPAERRPEFDAVLAETLAAATLQRHPRAGAADPAGRVGRHTEALSALVEDLQSVARAHPGATW
jgi:ring-1,2-phenylacetyl-CoA epoxidase subunit PaaC